MFWPEKIWTLPVRSESNAKVAGSMALIGVAFDCKLVPPIAAVWLLGTARAAERAWLVETILPICEAEEAPGITAVALS